MKKTLGIALIILTGLATAAPTFAAKGKPGFVGSLWGDGQLWSSKFTTEIPAPSDSNVQSYDMLFVIINSNAEGGQLPVSEAAPGNPDFDGGRWFVQTAWWTQQGLEWYGTVPMITSYDQLLWEVAAGNMGYHAGSPEGGPPPYFQCPLLPVKY